MVRTQLSYRKYRRKVDEMPGTNRTKHPYKEITISTREFVVCPLAAIVLEITTQQQQRKVSVLSLSYT